MHLNNLENDYVHMYVSDHVNTVLPKQLATYIQGASKTTYSTSFTHATVQMLLYTCTRSAD